MLHAKGDHAAPKLTAPELPPELREIRLDDAAPGEYVGTYRGVFGSLAIVLKENYLEAQIAGQPAFQIFASARNRFFYKVVDAQLEFERDASGKVTRVVLHQNGNHLRAPRMADQR